jgi:hypothetical protein
VEKYADRGAVRTLEEVGRIVGLTKQRVRQIEAAAFIKLYRSPILRRMAIEMGCPVPPPPPRRPPRQRPARAAVKTLFD